MVLQAWRRDAAKTRRRGRLRYTVSLDLSLALPFRIYHL